MVLLVSFCFSLLYDTPSSPSLPLLQQGLFLPFSFSVQAQVWSRAAVFFLPSPWVWASGWKCWLFSFVQHRKCTLIPFTSKQSWSWSSLRNLLRISIFLSLPAVTREIPATSSAYSGPWLVELPGKVTQENFGSLPVIHKPRASKVIVTHSTWAKMWAWAWELSRALEMSCYVVVQGYWGVTCISLSAPINGCSLEVTFFFLY